MNNLKKNYNIIDLTHSLSSKIASWEGDCGFHLKNKIDYDQGVRVQAIQMRAGIGTHIDAPSHFIPDGDNIAQLAIANLITSAYVIDVREKVHPDYFISADDIDKFEKQHGRIEADSLVIALTGWEQHWTDPAKYRNVDDKGKMHFPGFSPQSVELLLQRGINGVAIDTLSPDGSDMTFPVHHLLLGAGKYIIENIANCALLPAKGACIVALPIKVADGTEAPLRIIALLEKHQ
ncbi:unnamed protein product [marine sediment metagenome]|uniref:Cyclase family protein n=1 Tax=marine sediment metagenome TaxID=412755 RepID=X1AQ59_9ZZZZ